MIGISWPFSTITAVVSTYDLRSHGLLVRWTAPEVNSVLQNRPQIQLESTWLLPHQACHEYANGYNAWPVSIAVGKRNFLCILN